MTEQLAKQDRYLAGRLLLVESVQLRAAGCVLLARVLLRQDHVNEVSRRLLSNATGYTSSERGKVGVQGLGFRV